MFIEIAALLSIFQLICAGVSTNLLFSNSENLTENISDDMKFKNIQDQLELLQTMNQNLSGEMTSLGLALNNLLTKQRNEMKDDLEELKAALTYVPKNCAEAMKTSGRNGIYRIEVPDSGLPPFPVYCLKNNSIELSKENEDNNGSGSTADPWMVIQRRQDGSVDFFRNWVDYKLGFGNLEGEFFIGLDKLRAITSSRIHELWIQMEDFEGGRRWAKYSTFAIGDESDGYRLNVLGNYSGDAGDSLAIHKAQKWTTKDHGNSYCAQQFIGAWWYKNCYDSNLNGQYIKGGYVESNSYSRGVNWKSWRGHLYSLKYVHMAIRPVPNRC